MSLTSTLLTADPETMRQLIKALPKGRIRKHKIDDSAPENCEIVHATIAAGARTVRDIQCATGLYKTTIWRAIMQLEAWPTGPRIERDSNRKPAQFTIHHA